MISISFKTRLCFYHSENVALLGQFYIVIFWTLKDASRWVYISFIRTFMFWWWETTFCRHRCPAASKAAKMRRQHLSPPIDTGESVTGGNVPELSWPRTRHMARTEHDSNSQFIGY